MNSAKGHRELVADLQSHRARLSEAQVASVSGASSADQTGLRGNEIEVGFVAKSRGSLIVRYAFVDLGVRMMNFAAGATLVLSFAS
jgi:hypothetical protein